tara:strand:- start:695 stop:2179 length:1485 start_codon:yes stop_codon:yes gene_type:complete
MDINATDSVSTFGSVATARAKIWKETFKHFGNTTDVTSALEGPEGSGSAISTRHDLKGKRGAIIEFLASSDLGAFGKLGEQTLKGNEEKLLFSGTTVTLDFKRHATALTQSLRKKMAGGHTLESLSSEVLGRHFGQWKQRDALRKLIDGVGNGGHAASLPDNIKFGGSASTINTLYSADEIGTGDVTDLVTQAAWLGVEPARITKGGKSSAEDTYHHILLADNQQLRPLYKDPAYQTRMQNADVRGTGNSVFNGSFKDIDGTKILNFRGVYGDQYGPIGSPLTPVMRLGTAIANTGSGTSVLTGSASTPAATDPNWFIDFPGFDYKYTDEDAADTSDDATKYYALAVTPAGGFAFFEYTGAGNLGYKIEVAAAQWATNTVITGSGSTVDGNAAAFDGKLVTALPVGTLIFPATLHGVPYAYSLLLGSDALVRGYGEDMKMTDDMEDYGFRKGIGYQAMYGDNVWTDRNGRVRNYILAAHAYNPIGKNCPTVTAA